MVQAKVLTGEMRERILATEYEPATFEVEKSHITSFARAIGDDNPLWNDEISARTSKYGGLIAPPTFTRLIVNSLRLPGTVQYALPGTVQVRRWNAVAILRAHQTWRPDHPVSEDHRRLRAAGVRQGRYSSSSQTAGSSTSSTKTAVTMTGVTIRYEPGRHGKASRPSNPGNGRPTGNLAPSAPSAIEPLDRASVTERTSIGPFIKYTSTQDLVKYAGASRDFSEIHYDKDFALGAGLPGVIIHGALKSAYLGRLMTDWVGDPGALKSLQCQHRGMDFPSESVVCKGRVVRKYEEGGELLADCEIWIENGRGETTGSRPGHHFVDVTVTFAVVHHTDLQRVNTQRRSLTIGL